MSTPEAFVGRIPPDDMDLSFASLRLDGPCIFLVRCNGKKFFVELLPPNYDPAANEPDYSYDIMHGYDPGIRYPPVLPPLPGYDPPHSIELMYLTQLYEKMNPSEGVFMDLAGNQILYEVENLILTIGASTIRELAGCGKERVLRETLEDAVYPETIFLQMVTIDGEAKLIQRPDCDLPIRPLENEDVSGLHSDLPLFHPSEIEILETIAPERSYKVLVGGAVRFCKVEFRGFFPVSRDYNILQQIHDLHLDPLSLRVPHLEGFVSLGGEKKVIGILTNYVEKQSLLEDFLPDYKGKQSWTDPGVVSMVTKPRKEKWANQIEHGIRLLHHAGVVWGDVYPPNVIIDKNDDVWLTAFGGSYHPPFVSYEKHETKEGDLEGLAMIRKLLGLYFEESTRAQGAIMDQV